MSLATLQDNPSAESSLILGRHNTRDWHDSWNQQVIMPVAPYNLRNTDEPLQIEYRVEDRIENHSEDIQFKQSTLDKTYSRQTQVERTNKACKDCGLGRAASQEMSSTEERIEYRNEIPAFSQR